MASTAGPESNPDDHTRFGQWGVFFLNIVLPFRDQISPPLRGFERRHMSGTFFKTWRPALTISKAFPSVSSLQHDSTAREKGAEVRHMGCSVIYAQCLAAVFAGCQKGTHHDFPQHIALPSGAATFQEVGETLCVGSVQIGVLFEPQCASLKPKI